MCDIWEKLVGGSVRMLPLPSAEVSASWLVSLINMVRFDWRKLLGGRVNWNTNVKERTKLKGIS